MAQTLSGKQLPGHDRQSEPETIAQLKSMNDDLKVIYGALDGYIGADGKFIRTVDSQTRYLAREIKREGECRAHVQEEIIAAINDTRVQLKPLKRFLLSRFVRFLNFFGKWFIYRKETIGGKEYWFVDLRDEDGVYIQLF